MLHPEQRDGKHIYISFEAAEAIGFVIKIILKSPKVTIRLKGELLSVALNTLKMLELHTHLEPLAKKMRDNLINPYHSTDQEYLDILKECFDKQDHALRVHLRHFSSDLETACGA